MDNDESNLRLLSIFYYVLGGASAAFSSLFLGHFVWGLGIVRGWPAFAQAKGAPPHEFGYVLMAVGAAIVAAGWSMGVCMILAGRSIARRSRHTFCLVVAALACVVCNPFGVILGVFTIVILTRPSVKALFDQGASQP